MLSGETTFRSRAGYPRPAHARVPVGMRGALRAAFLIPVAVSRTRDNETALIRLSGEGVTRLSRQQDLYHCKLPGRLTLQRLGGLSLFHSTTGQPHQSNEVRAGRDHNNTKFPLRHVEVTL